MNKSLLGKRVMIVGKHPHKNEVGTIKTIEKTAIGYGIRISLANGQECFVFKPEHLRLL